MLSLKGVKKNHYFLMPKAFLADFLCILIRGLSITCQNESEVPLVETAESD